MPVVVDCSLLGAVRDYGWKSGFILGTTGSLAWASGESPKAASYDPKSE